MSLTAPDAGFKVEIILFGPKCKSHDVHSNVRNLCHGRHSTVPRSNFNQIGDLHADSLICQFAFKLI